MNLETPQPTHSESFDSKWYQTFEQLGAFQAYEYLDGNKQYREAERHKFLNSDDGNPSLDYPKIDVERLSSDETQLLQLKEDIIREETNEIVKQVYRWRLNEKIAELRMLKAVASGDMHKFQRYSEFVYGKPSPEIFAFTIHNLREIATSQLTSDDPNIKNVAQELIDLLPADLPTTANYQLPQESDITIVRKQTLKELGNLLNLDVATGTEGKQYTADEIRDIFQASLESLQAEGWSVVVDTSSKSGISVDQEHKEIKIPESRKLVFTKLRSLVAHEVGTHIARRLNGERSKLHLLGLGLDRYEKGEEGVATMREQVLGDSIEDFAGLDGHLAISLAIGVDGKPRDFREVYTIMEKYFYLNALSAGKISEEALKSAQTSAWNRTVRTFRGTDCKTKGVCFTKDIVYREGNIGVWKVASNNPEEIVRFSVGKYDPANCRHIWILDQLGFSETDLEELRK